MTRLPGTGASRGASMADVARLAGVSGQTVSRVANGNRRVTPETRRRVEAAMERLGYRANIAARALATGRFGSIGVVTFNLTAVGNIRILETVSAGAQARGYSINLALVDTPTEHDVRAAVRGLTDRAVDGVIVLEARVLDTPLLQIPVEVPVVIADSRVAHPHPTFGMDEAAGAGAAVRHLLDLGHRTVHHLAGPTESNPAQRRRSAWRRMLERAGRPVPHAIIGDWSPQSGYHSALQLLRDDTVTAIFAANDEMATGVLRAAAELGRSVPGDLSVVGYDNLAISAYLSPSLTTVQQDLGAVGERCLEHLLTLIESSAANAPQRSRLVQPELVIRESTGPPPHFPNDPGNKINPSTP